MEGVLVVRINKRHVSEVTNNLKSHGWNNPNYRISSSDTNTHVLVPINEGVSHSNLDDLFQLLGIDEYTFCHVHTSRLCPPKGTDPSIVKIRTYLVNNCGWEEGDAETIPNKWIKYGDVVMLESDVAPRGRASDVVRAFREVYPDARCILLHVGPVTGELRKPQIALFTPNESPVTIHVENGTKFKFDTQHVMFSPGNGTERIRFSRLKVLQNEFVIDMFAGLGYFSLPLTKNNQFELQQLVAIEKNPVSFAFLEENIQINKLSHKMVAICGDNRTVGQEHVGKVDRILMGYLPNTKDFIPRALEFGNPQHCIYHYHHLCSKERFKTEALEDFSSELLKLNLRRNITLIDFVKVKSYAPKLYHCVADIKLTILS